MSVAIWIAIAIWVGGEVVLGLAWFLAQTRFLVEYRQRYGGFASPTENVQQLLRDPVHLLRGAPRDWTRKASAQMRPTEDPAIDSHRRRMWRLYVFLIGWGFLGLPTSLLILGLIKQVALAAGLT